MSEQLRQRIFQVGASGDFDRLALEVFAFQFEQNPVYRAFCQSIGCKAGSIRAPEEIPFLPVELFATRDVMAFRGEPEAVFVSSGTSGGPPARHHVAELAVYEESFLKGFRIFYGDPAEYVILALLPSYLERENASLVYMARGLMESSGRPGNGFFLHDMSALAARLKNLVRKGQKALLLGVSFALLDLAAACPMPLPGVVVMETGGMKGRREELVREELHRRLKQAFGLEQIHSEYGMTEMLSQAYSRGEGLFACPPWMRVLMRNELDPFDVGAGKRSGGINVIDLANLYSCSFLATQDLGRLHPDGCFEVLGRFDHSEVRGCNLMVG